jgi:hypothetical protein
MPTLYVLNGADLGRSFAVDAGALIGRSPECAVPLSSSSVSRQHARVESSGAGWRIVDLGSRNGLLRAGGRERLAHLELSDGAEFQVGEVLLRFRSTSVASAPAADTPLRPSTAPAAAPPVAPPVAPPAALAEIELEPLETAPAAPTSPAAPRALRSAPAPSQVPAEADARAEFVRQLQRQSSGGWWHADFEQLPGLAKVALGLLALCVCAGLAYAAFAFVVGARM